MSKGLFVCDRGHDPERPATHVMEAGYIADEESGETRVVRYFWCDDCAKEFPGKVEELPEMRLG